MILGPINQVDQTWINGRAVGNTFGYGTERSYQLAPGMLHAGQNHLVINVLSNYGGGGLLAGGAPRVLQPAVGPPVPLNGAWEYRVAPTAFGYPPRTPWESVGGPDYDLQFHDRAPGRLRLSRGLVVSGRIQHR